MKSHVILREFISLFVVILVLFSGVWAFRYVKHLYLLSHADYSGFYVAEINNQSAGSGQAKVLSSQLVDTRLYAPQFVSNYSGYQSTIYLFNPNSQSVTVTAKFNGQPLTSATQTLNPHQTAKISGSGLAASTNYAVEVSASLPIAGYMTTSRGTNDISALHLIPAKLAGTIVANSKFYVNYASNDGKNDVYNTGHSIMNIADYPIKVRIYLKNDYKTTSLSPLLINNNTDIYIPPKTSLNIYAPSVIGQSYAGTLTAEVVWRGGSFAGPGELVSTYQATLTNFDTMSYAGVTDTETSQCSVIMPVFYNAYGVITGFTIQNIQRNYPVDIEGPNQYQIVFYDNRVNPYSGYTLNSTTSPNSIFGNPTGLTSLDFGESKKHYLGTPLQNGFAQAFQGKIFSLKVCASGSLQKISALENSAAYPANNSSVKFIMGDSGFSDSWKGNEFYGILTDNNLLTSSAFNLFNPAGSLNLKAAIFNSQGTLVNTKMFYLAQYQTLIIFKGRDLGLPENFLGTVIFTTQ